MPGGSHDIGADPNLFILILTAELKKTITEWLKYLWHAFFSFGWRTRCASEITYFRLREYSEPLLTNCRINIRLERAKFSKTMRKYFPYRKVPTLRLENESPFFWHDEDTLGAFTRSGRIYIFTDPHANTAYPEQGAKGMRLMVTQTILHELGHWEKMPSALTYIAPINPVMYLISFISLIVTTCLLALSPSYNIIFIFFGAVIAVIFFGGIDLKLHSLKLPEKAACDFEKHISGDLGREIADCLEVNEVKPDY